jgi:nucleotide-binding universal stress UspA family protein
MKPVKKILFPIDLSDVSPKIAPWVIMMAEMFKAQICLLFVARTFEYLYSFHLSQKDIDNFVLRFAEGAEAKIKEFAKTNLREYSNFKTDIVSGDPADAILEYIEPEEINLVIMGTHGRKGLDRILFGSVADRVVKMSPVPVLTINPYRVPSAEIEEPSSK